MSTVIHCLGDSHIEMFGAVNRKKLLANTQITTFLVGGATALGLPNPRSHTQALTKFKQRLKRISKDHFVLFHLGEVDCGFTIWWRADHHGDDVDNQMMRSFTNYTNFIKDTYNDGYKNIIVSSCPLPTIPDSYTGGKVAKMREHVRATQLQRTQLTQRFNRLLQQHCKEQGYLFLDYEADILDTTTGLVAEQFRNRDPKNHHLDNNAVAPVLAKCLTQLGFT